ncbi:hypothetical protein CBR_g30636 [Chara braunii]|uniref:Zinc finger C5HC2-type domain-containing protein n=1 Tax=Chara braunii TaxID=69332 RepID=A0A388LD90_CHABU|nr:hypothetical protein CBR_g30636 [Chara braunii]|eukprot:GBG80270.1 hypothetical protein CBR_g30636 [Chara braunii]
MVSAVDGGVQFECRLADEMVAMIKEETELREAVCMEGTVRSERLPSLGPKKGSVCVFCTCSLYLSALTCSCSPGKLACLQHGSQLCKCSARMRKMVYVKSIMELEELSKQVKALVRGEDKRARPKSSQEEKRNTTVAKFLQVYRARRAERIADWLQNADALVKMKEADGSKGVLEKAEALLVLAEEFIWGELGRWKKEKVKVEEKVWVKGAGEDTGGGRQGKDRGEVGGNVGRNKADNKGYQLEAQHLTYGVHSYTFGSLSLK